jgi:hypothetical protein
MAYIRKDLSCKICGELVKNVSLEATHVTCWKCVSDQLRGMPTPANNDTEEEWDEDHALDMVLNEMVKDLEDEDLLDDLEEDQED